MFREKFKILRGTVVVMLIFSWIFSGFPQFFNFPPEIEKTQATHCTDSPCTITATETFTVPANVTSLDITMRGGGGAGGSGSAVQTARGGGGGGGGAYTACTVTVTAEAPYTVTVGAQVTVAGSNGEPSSFPGDDGTCTANGGTGGSNANANGGAGGTAQTVAGIVTAAFAGGAGGGGRNATNGGGGGGGEAAGTTATGNDGTTATTGTGAAGGTGGDGADGGAGGDNTLGGNPGTAPGGGGGGPGGTNDDVGAGERGEIILTWTAGSPADLSWDTGAADFEIWAGATATTDAVNTWDNGTLICSTFLNDDNDSLNACGTLNKNQKYRVQAVLDNDGGTAASMASGDFVDHVNVKTFWAGTSPTISAATDCGFADGATFGESNDDTSTTCNVAFSGNNVRITNTGTEVLLAATTGTEGFMYLITTDSDIPLSNPSTYMNASIDSITEDSSRISIGLKRNPGIYIGGGVKIRGLVKFR